MQVLVPFPAHKQTTHRRVKLPDTLTLKGSNFHLIHQLSTSMSLSKHIDDLFNECLVPVLARVPFNDLVRHVPLTSQRWKSLLNLAIRDRNSLQIYKNKNHYWKCKQPRTQFINTGRASADDYVKYLDCLLNQSDDHQLYAPCDHYLRKSLRDPFSIKFCDTFLHLEHLALVDIRICPHALLRLLEHFQKSLKSLFLKPSKKTDCFWNCEHPQIAFPLSILSVINSMTSLRQLALWENYFPRIEGSLSEVLSRLEELHLVEYHFDYVEILSQVDETKFRRLTLENGSWINGKLSTLVREKPGLGQLTHLNVNVQSGESLIPIFVKIFPLLEHLGINAGYTPLRKWIPVVSQLKSLSSLKMATNRWPLDVDFPVEYSLESLQALRLATYLRIDDLSVIRELYPNLRQLYLDAVQFQCRCLQSKPTFFTLPSLRQPGCTCKARIAKHLESFKYLPKISLN